MDTRAFFVYLGPPTLFIMLCMIAVGWVSSIAKRKFVPNQYRWVTGWGALGCFLAISLAIAAWVMNNDFVYSHCSMVWPFRLWLIVLDGHPTLAAGLLLICLMGIMNGLYYAVVAAFTLNIVRLLPEKIVGLRIQRIVGSTRTTAASGSRSVSR